jgi:hypothetical protein
MDPIGIKRGRPDRASVQMIHPFFALFALVEGRQAITTGFALELEVVEVVRSSTQ